MSERCDEFHVYMPSGRRFVASVPTPLTVEDKAWLHKLIDLILDETMLETQTQQAEALVNGL